MPSSSNHRAFIPGDAVVVQKNRDLGPVRLPVNRSDDFIHDFNRTYGNLGLRLDARGIVSTEDPLASPRDPQPKN